MELKRFIGTVAEKCPSRDPKNGGRISADAAVAAVDEGDAGE
jgi:hypothetical protein